MHCTKKITNDLTWVGANDRRLAMFEGVYSVPNGVSYNSYLLIDDVTVLFDTVDKAVSRIFFQNVKHVLNGKTLDYVVVQHMEPDHSATLHELIIRYPEVVVICNQKTATMLNQFFDVDFSDKLWIVDESTMFNTGHHEFQFVFAPMVHWPEVMVTYDKTDKILFSADAFGTFGALNGAIFADEVDFNADYMAEARRYYTNIVGKYGTQVSALLNKASNLDIAMICPLHGFVWRYNLNDYIDKYQRWATYTPETKGVMIAYASVYGHTENVAEIISSRLRDLGIKTKMYDVSVTPTSELVATAFEYSHLLFASTTYNAGVFITMEEVLRDIVAHNLKNRTVAFVENGSWAPTAGKQMKEILSKLQNITYLDETISIRSSLRESQVAEIDALVNAIKASFDNAIDAEPTTATTAIDNKAVFSLSYGLYVLTTNNGAKDNGCIINTAQLLTDNPKRMTIAVNKANYSHDTVMKTKAFNISILTEEVPFKVFEHFGFKSGREVDKFADYSNVKRSSNGLLYLSQYTNAYISAKVLTTYDYGTHTLFVAEIQEAQALSDNTSVTYDYYFKHIKPKPQLTKEPTDGYVCKVCGYVYEGTSLPADYVCPLCKHGVDDFEKIK